MSWCLAWDSRKVLTIPWFYLFVFLVTNSSLLSAKTYDTYTTGQTHIPKSWLMWHFQITILYYHLWCENHSIGNWWTFYTTNYILLLEMPVSEDTSAEWEKSTKIPNKAIVIATKTHIYIYYQTTQLLYTSFTVVSLEIPCSSTTDSSSVSMEASQERLNENEQESCPRYSTLLRFVHTLTFFP